MSTSLDFLKLNNMFFFRNYFFNYMIKIKINNYIIKFILKEKKKKKNKYPAKPTKRSNHGYLTKLANQVIDSINFNNLVFLKLFFI
jgi:hypothetical protein